MAIDEDAYQADVAAVRDIFEREHEQAVRAGLVTQRYGSNARPRRKQGLDVWCANDGCPNGLLGPAAMARADEFPSWLLGRRKDAAYCSNACRQKAYRRRQAVERAEWTEIIADMRPAIVAAFPETERISASDWKTWRRIVEAVIERIDA